MLKLHHISALESLPAEVFVSPRLVVSRSCGENTLERIVSPQEPTAAMRELSEDDSEDK